MAKIIEIAGKEWLVGLSWASYEDHPNKVELKEDAERLESDWVVVRDNQQIVQAGFCQAIDGIKRPVKLASLGAYLADSHEQPWLGTFKIADNLWWYLAVRDGHAILPNGDIVGDEQEIRSARENHAGYMDWNYVEGDLIDLERFLSGINTKPTMAKSLSANAITGTTLTVTAFTIAALIGGGYYYWHQKELQEEQAILKAQQAMKAQLTAGKPLPPAPSPLITTPKPNEWLKSCTQIIGNQPLSLYGWELDKVMCDTTNVHLYWLRKVGATVSEKPEGILSPEGNAIDQAIALQNIQNADIDDSINLEAAKLQLRAWAQAAEFTLSINNIAPVSLPGAAPLKDKDGNLLPPPRPQTDFAIDLPVSPLKLDFSSIPGLRLTQINTSGSAWHIEGILYGK